MTRAMVTLHKQTEKLIETTIMSSGNTNYLVSKTGYLHLISTLGFRSCSLYKCLDNFSLCLLIVGIVNFKAFFMKFAVREV